MTLGPRAVLTLNLTAVAAALLLTQPAGAQTEPAPADKGLERAQKAADAVFHWIKLNADKGASRQTPAPAPAPPPAPRKPAPVAAAPKPVQPSAAAAATAARAAAPAVTAAPEPEQAPVLVAAASPTPTPEAPMAAAARAVEPPPAPAEEAEVPLKLLVKVDPIMPRQMQQLNFRNGFAQVQFTVAPDGRVSQAQTLKASHSRLGNAAVEAVRQWRFAPIAKAREAAVEVAFSNGEE